MPQPPRSLLRSSQLFSLALLVYLAAAPALAQSRPPLDNPGRRSTSIGAVILDSTLTILENADAPPPIRNAAEDLATDFGKVFGTRPRIIERKEDAARVTILVGEQSQIPETMRSAGLSDPESFSISVTEANWNTTRATDVILLSGADMRGTIYAIYEFSQKYLGIDPLYYW